jgi:hypothetical protein
MGFQYESNIAGRIAQYASRGVGRPAATRPRLLGDAGGAVFPVDARGGASDRHLFDKWLSLAEKQAALPKLDGGLWPANRRCRRARRDERNEEAVRARGRVETRHKLDRSLRTQKRHSDKTLWRHYLRIGTAGFEPAPPEPHSSQGDGRLRQDVVFQRGIERRRPILRSSMLHSAARNSTKTRPPQRRLLDGAGCSGRGGLSK